MHDETMQLIHRLAKERLDLYLLAGKQHLSLEQKERISAITARLAVLWDQYRREYAAARYQGWRSASRRDESSEVRRAA